MATVTSFTAQRILELAAGWEQVTQTQSETDAVISQLNGELAANQEAMDHLTSVTMPELQQSLAANDVALSDLNDNVLVDLQATLAQNSLDIQNLNTVTIPSISEKLSNEIENTLVRPKVYVQPDEPTNPDEDDRYLVAGDTWFDSDDNNRQRIWNGSEWTTFNVDVSDFSLTVRKFMTSTHMIY